MADTLMNAKDTVSGALGKCYVTLHKNAGDERYLLMQVTKVEAKIDKTKTEVPIMGKTGKGNKATGWKGTGTATLHYCTSIFRELLEQYKRTGEDIYFDMEVYNQDGGSAAGKQITILKQCNLDGGIIAKIDANSEVLDEDISFTFDDFTLKTSFTPLSGMTV
jgi:hypothetical protein